MSMIPKQKNIKLMILKNCDHNTAPRLKKLRKIDRTINKFFSQ